MLKKTDKPITITDSIISFLATTGRKGATLSEIYKAVWADVGEHVRDTSVRSIVYQRLPGAKKGWKPYFERFVVDGKTHYKLLEPRTK